MTDFHVPRKLWEHPNPESTQIDEFRRKVNKKRALEIKTYKELHKWSVEHVAEFWQEAWDYLEPIYDGTYTTVVDTSVRMDAIPKWFEGTYVNFAENILYSRSRNFPKERRSTRDKQDDKVAIINVREGGAEAQEYSWKQLRKDVARLSAAMRKRGVKKGDRIALVAANAYSTIVVTLSAATIGAIFSTSSTDMGVKGVLDRLLQIEPTYLFYDDQALYNGKHVDLRANIKAVSERMKNVSNFKGTVIIPRYPGIKEKVLSFDGISNCQTWDKFIEGTKDDEELVFEKVKFEDPLFIAYSSGTTGQPKCIVHCSGGVVITSRMETRLQYGLDASSIKLQYTTTGWIMFMASFQALQVGAKAVLYDGSPFIPDPLVLLRLIERYRITVLGVSPRYFTELQTRKYKPRELFNLESLQSVTSTGMVLSEQLYEWFYDEGFPKKTQLVNISGGTDMASTFATGNQLEPVYVGQLQCMRLAMKVEVVDQTSSKMNPVVVEHGTPGELTCAVAFPTMPVMFWGKDGAKKYHNAYFDRFDNRWNHGDFVIIHPKTGGQVFLGRSDGVLNPSGVRFGSAEIYNVVTQHFDPVIADSLCVGQRRPSDTDEQVLLFIKMRPGHIFTRELVKQIREKIAKELSKRHVPKYIFDLQGEIPTTINGKKVELPVKEIVCGKKVIPSGTLANPESLNFFYKFVDVENIAREMEENTGTGDIRAKL